MSTRSSAESDVWSSGLDGLVWVHARREQDRLATWCLEETGRDRHRTDPRGRPTRRTA